MQNMPVFPLEIFIIMAAFIEFESPMQLADSLGNVLDTLPELTIDKNYYDWCYEEGCRHSNSPQHHYFEQTRDDIILQ